MRLTNYLPLLGFITIILTLCYAMSFAYNPKDYVYKIYEAELTLSSNKKLDLKDFRGRFYVLHLSASWCEACRGDYPILEKIKHDTKAVIINVAVRDKRPKTNPVYDYVAIDKDMTIAKMLKSQAIPETLIINPEGIVMFHYVGALSKKEIEDNAIPNMILK